MALSLSLSLSLCMAQLEISLSVQGENDTRGGHFTSERFKKKGLSVVSLLQSNDGEGDTPVGVSDVESIVYAMGELPYISIKDQHYYYGGGHS